MLAPATRHELLGGGVRRRASQQLRRVALLLFARLSRARGGGPVRMRSSGRPAQSGRAAWAALRLMADITTSSFFAELVFANSVFVILSTMELGRSGRRRSCGRAAQAAMVTALASYGVVDNQCQIPQH